MIRVGEKHDQNFQIKKPSSDSKYTIFMSVARRQVHVFSILSIKSRFEGVEWEFHFFSLIWRPQINCFTIDRGSQKHLISAYKSFVI